jgi:hypothetical protein
MPYADWLAHRNSVATKELASAVIAWVYRRAALLVDCEIPGGPIFFQRIASGPPTTASVRTGAVGSRRLATARTKQHTVCMKLALSCANVALERLAWHC